MKNSTKTLKDIPTELFPEIAKRDVPQEEVAKQVQQEAIYPSKFQRDESGKINWRAMINPRYLVVKKEAIPVVEKIHGKKLSEIDISEIDDKYLLILLGGIRELAEIRGFSSVDYSIQVATPEYCAVKCTVHWNRHEDLPYQAFTGMASASYNNCSDFVRHYTLEIAENRAFVRAVRNYLNIGIVGKDEITFDKDESEDSNVSASLPNPTDPKSVLINKLKKNNRSFEGLKEWWADKKKDESVLKWASFDDISIPCVLEILGAMKDSRQSI